MNYDRGSLRGKIVPILLALGLIKTKEELLTLREKSPWSREETRIVSRPVIIIRLTERGRRFVELFDGLEVRY